MIQESATPIRQWDSTVLGDYLQADRTPTPSQALCGIKLPTLKEA